ncbi:MAG TPA: helix-turn-helix domain-containing protein [Bacteroidota bacterium]|nr:helix-turn-helix domain-containing protein [Bacteroidota bacterium]
MNTFSDELRKERVAKDISLADISRKTHINVKYLEAIEQGSFDILPQTYVRAFIREYALVVGLAPESILKKFDIMVGGKYSVENGPMVGSGWTNTPLPTLAEQNTSSLPHTGVKPELIRHNDNRTAAIGIAVAVVVAAMAYFMYDYATQDTKMPVAQETPFQEVVKEQETQLLPQKAALDTFAALQAAPRPDSLTLRGVTVDSVWISISRDGAPPQTAMLPPKSARTWAAAKQFTLTLGNAGGIRFALNGTELGALGKRGAVLRNVVLSLASLKPKP